MGASMRFVLRAVLFAGVAVCGCQSRNAGVSQGLQRQGPSPLAARTNPSSSGWNNQPTPTTASTSTPSTGTMNQTGTSPSVGDMTSTSRPMGASQPYMGATGAATRSTAFPSTTPSWGQNTSSPWQQNTPTAYPATGNLSGPTPTTGAMPSTTPAPTWPSSSTPSSRITTPMSDPMIPSTSSSTTGSNYQTRYPSMATPANVPTMPPVRNGDD